MVFTGTSKKLRWGVGVGVGVDDSDSDSSGNEMTNYQNEFYQPSLTILKEYMECEVYRGGSCGDCGGGGGGGSGSGSGGGGGDDDDDDDNDDRKEKLAGTDKQVPNYDGKWIEIRKIMI
ncbi:hypothetical protein G9A89_009701 [Geosiphon pyriformis]|nr:hypothetical protein G9A89_009701 [Geosiphon pyriformis]